MAWTFAELKDMSIDDLKNAYDKRYAGKIESREFIISEIARRENKKQTEEIVGLTKTMKNLTWAVVGLTVLNLGLIILNIFSK